MQLKSDDIAYQMCADGTIELMPTLSGSIPSIVIPMEVEKVVLERLKVCGDINIRRAAIFQANALECVHGNLSLQLAEEIQVKSLNFVRGYTDAMSATAFHADSLKKTGPIFLSQAMAHHENETLLFSGQIGSKRKISIFNKNTGMVKTEYYPWLKLDTMEEIMESLHPRGKRHDQYIKYFDLCRNKMQIK